MIPLLLFPPKCFSSICKFTVYCLLLHNARKHLNTSTSPASTNITVVFLFLKKYQCFLFILEAFSLSSLLFTNEHWWDFPQSEPESEWKLLHLSIGKFSAQEKLQESRTQKITSDKVSKSVTTVLSTWLGKATDTEQCFISTFICS